MALLDILDDSCSSEEWRCIGCGARETSASRPFPCSCGCEESWILESPVGAPSKSARAVLATDLSDAPLPMLPTGEPALDALLGGGVALGSVVFVYGRQGSGKSRLLYRWATRERALIVCTELSLPVARLNVATTGGRLEHAYLLSELGEWRSEAARIGVRSVVIDSLASSANATAFVRAARDWAQRKNSVVWVIQHATKRGDARGTTSSPHWADYEMRTSKPTPTATTTRIEVLKTRLGPTGIVSAAL